MYCRNCGKEIEDKAVVCVLCGVPPKIEKKYCQNCGVNIQANQTICVECGASISLPSPEKSKFVAGLLALLLGSFGAHKFYLGYTHQGIITILVWWGGLVLPAVAAAEESQIQHRSGQQMSLSSLLTIWMLFGAPTLVMSIIVLIEGIGYLTKSDDEFRDVYIANKRSWL